MAKMSKKMPMILASIVRLFGYSPECFISYRKTNNEMQYVHEREYIPSNGYTEIRRPYLTMWSEEYTDRYYSVPFEEGVHTTPQTSIVYPYPFGRLVQEYDGCSDDDQYKPAPLLIPEDGIVMFEFYEHPDYVPASLVGDPRVIDKLIMWDCFSYSDNSVPNHLTVDMWNVNELGPLGLYRFAQFFPNLVNVSFDITRGVKISYKMFENLINLKILLITLLSDEVELNAEGFLFDFNHPMHSVKLFQRSSVSFSVRIRHVARFWAPPAYITNSSVHEFIEPHHTDND